MESHLMASATSTSSVDAAQLAIASMPSRAKPPTLQNGDRLNRTEFERRYSAMPELKIAELINGIVYMGPPVSTSHGTPHGAMTAWMGVYVAHTPGLAFVPNVTVRLDE